MTTADAACPPTVETGFSNSRRFAQTFRALRGGQLTSASVNLLLNAEGADFDLEIRDVDETGGLATGFLASTAIANVPATNPLDDSPRTITGIFAAPAIVAAGQQYTLVVSETSALGYTIQNGNGDACPDGNIFLDELSTGDFIPFAGGVLVFATFVTA